MRWKAETICSGSTLVSPLHLTGGRPANAIRSGLIGAAARPYSMAYPNRRQFCTDAARLVVASTIPATRLLAQGAPSPFNDLRPDVATIDHNRILAAADRALAHPPAPLTTFPAPQSPAGPQEYYSEAEPNIPAGPDATPQQPAPFTAHRNALLALGLAVPALAAAQLITGDRRYSEAAARSLRAWFIAADTRMLPRMELGHTAIQPLPATSPKSPSPPTLEPATPHPASAPDAPHGSLGGILETIPLVEVVQAIPFLEASGSLTPEDLAGLRTWFSSYLEWLTAEQASGPRLGALARDSKDHNATSWLLQVAVYTLFTLPQSTAPRAEDSSMTELRHRFRSVTLRSQFSAAGFFPNEISTQNPYRNSLFNLDMMACICLLLSTRFESLWDFQLQDGPGMRAAIAYHFPFIANRARWPYRADAEYFNQLPSRRASLLFCARPYQRPEYTALWKTLPPDPDAQAVLQTLPVHQPLLWVATPRPAGISSVTYSRGAADEVWPSRRAARPLSGGAWETETPIHTLRTSTDKPPASRAPGSEETRRG